MIVRKLGRTGLSVSLVSHGSGGPSRLGQETGLTNAEQDALVRDCLDLGINLFDTSVAYGERERILGRALRGAPRESYIPATKWSPTTGDCFKDDPSKLVASVERSLRLLGTSHVDIMQLHGVLPEHYGGAMDRFGPTLLELKTSGKACHIGITEQFFSDASHTMLAMALRRDPEIWDTVMLKYGILNQSAAREVLPLASRHNVGVMNMASVRVKLTQPSELESLLAEWKERGLIPADAVTEKDPLGWLVGGGVDSVVSAGYKFAADHPAVATVLIGTSSREHLSRNVAALSEPRLPEDVHGRLIDLFGALNEPV